MKIIGILFQVGRNKNDVSRDLKLRLLAGVELAKENEEALVFFIGGGGLEISGAEMMKNFWIKKFPKIKNDCFLLNCSNNTFDNLNEVQRFIKERNILPSEIGIISNSYHIKRLQEISGKLNFGVVILSAESILISKDIQNEEVKKYLTSITYKRKLFLEWILRLYLSIDSRQRIIRIWRWFSYSK